MPPLLRCIIRPAAIAVVGCLWAVSLPAAEKTASYQAALDSITADELGATVTKLAEPAMEGREGGTRGGHAAGDYLTEQFTQTHLQPAGDNGGFFQPFVPNFRNVLGLLQGSDPELRSQVILVGAHYDHVGYGGRGTSLGPYGFIHPGADDNASGTAAVVELARAFSYLPGPPKRSVLFVAWDAEEKGLLGSKHWSAHPTVPLSQVVAALNMDVIGRLRDDHVCIFASRSGAGWRRLASQQNNGLDLKLEFTWGVKPNADYYPLFEKGIPVLMAHTGLHENYHRPSDTADRINREGMVRVTRLMFGVIYELAERGTVPHYRAAAKNETAEAEKALLAQAAKPADRMGVGWLDDPAKTGGVRLSMVTAGSPADRAGLRVGDCIVRFAGREIHSDDEFFAVVAAAESPASLAVKRPGEEESLDMTIDLAGSPLRWGIVWRADEAEPGTIILTHVVPGSPAARADLQAGDRIYQVGGRDFADDAVFAELAKALPDPVQLLVERDGRTRIVVVQFREAAPAKRAA